MNLIYANEELHRVVRDLTTGEDSILPRLRKAGNPCLGLLGEDSFPEEVKSLWNEVSRTFKEDMEKQNLTTEKAIDLVNKLLQIQFEVEMALKKRWER